MSPGCMLATDKVEGGLFVLFFGFVFSTGPLEIFLPTSYVPLLHI